MVFTFLIMTWQIRAIDNKTKFEAQPPRRIVAGDLALGKFSSGFFDSFDKFSGSAPDKFSRLGFSSPSNPPAHGEPFLQRVVTPVLPRKPWGRAYLLFVKIAGELLPGLAGLSGIHFPQMFTKRNLLHCLR
jgi:hypothetical protein